jgi:hypothetical protein
MADLHQPHAQPAHGEDNPEVHPEVHHEASDVNINAILGFGAGLAVAILVVVALIGLLMRFLDARERHSQPPLMYPLAVGQENRVPPEPRLQTDPREDLAELRAREDAQLHSYGWVDKNAGVVRIPIDDAIKLTLQRGLPSRQEPKP